MEFLTTIVMSEKEPVHYIEHDGDVGEIRISEGMRIQMRGNLYAVEEVSSDRVDLQKQGNEAGPILHLTPDTLRNHFHNGMATIIG